MTEYKIHQQDKFLAEHKSRFDKGKTDADSLKAKKQTMSSILNSFNDAPTKINIGNTVGAVSARPTKKDENELHGKDGSAIQV